MYMKKSHPELDMQNITYDISDAFVLMYLQKDYFLKSEEGQNLISLSEGERGILKITLRIVRNNITKPRSLNNRQTEKYIKDHFKLDFKVVNEYMRNDLKNHIE